jgi:hypothetical protein
MGDSAGLADKPSTVLVLKSAAMTICSEVNARTASPPGPNDQSDVHAAPHCTSVLC